MGEGLRISGGAWRGRKLAVPRGVRPTSAQLREALFSIWGERLPGARFGDLFAGSGCVGLEALSRGASGVLFVEASPRAARQLRRNCRLLGATSWELLVAGLPRSLPEHAGSLELLFADPPYAFARHPELLTAAAGLLGPEGRMALEHGRRAAPPPATASLELVESRRYGDSRLSFYRKG